MPSGQFALKLALCSFQWMALDIDKPWRTTRGEHAAECCDANGGFGEVEASSVLGHSLDCCCWYIIQEEARVLRYINESPNARTTAGRRESN